MKTILVDAWNTFVTPEGINKKLLSILEVFPNRKIILTNANEEEKIQYGIVNMPYEVFTCAHDPNKTNPEFYKKMLTYFNLKADDVVYFEHNTEAVASAKSLGIITFWYDKNKRDIEGVRTFLETNIFTV